MAKKSTKSDKPSINFAVDFSCKIRVSENGTKSFDRDLKRGELSLSLVYYVNGAMNGCSAYPDAISGGIRIEALSPSEYTVSAKGSFSTKDSFGKLPEILKADTTELIFEFVTDSDVNEHFIDGDSSKTLVIGKFVP